MAYKKILRKVAKKVKRAVKRRYVTKTGKGLRMGRIAKDVMMLKKMINAEKKLYQDKLSSAISVGQVGGNTSGHQLIDITPIPAQGSTSITRNGNSIKLNSAYYEFYFVKQSSATQSNKIVIDFWQVKGEPYTTAEVAAGNPVTDIFTPNEYVTGANIYDLVSSRRQDTFTDFKHLRSKVVYFPANQISGVTQTKLVRIPMKYGHHVKFASDGSQTLSAGQILMTIRCENGNKSTSTANTFGNIAVNSINTGFTFNYCFNSYFVDN